MTRKFDWKAGISGAIGALAGLYIPRIFPETEILQSTPAGIAIAVSCALISYLLMARPKKA